MRKKDGKIPPFRRDWQKVFSIISENLTKIEDMAKKSGKSFLKNFFWFAVFLEKLQFPKIPRKKDFSFSFLGKFFWNKNIFLVALQNKNHFFLKVNLQKIDRWRNANFLQIDFKAKKNKSSLQRTKKLTPDFFAISSIFVKFSDIIKNTFCQFRRNGGIFSRYFLASFGKTFQTFRHSLRLAERDLQCKFLFL